MFERKKGLYRTGNLLIDMDSNIIQKGKEKIFIPKASFTIISTLMDVPHKTVSRSALVFTWNRRIITKYWITL